MLDRDGILALLSARLSEKRLLHSLCVESRARELAAIHNGDAGKAALSGLLHDIFHDTPKAEQLKYLESRGILLDIFTKEHPNLWHSICAAWFVREDLHIEDGDVISAVRYHTTGRKGMSRLEKIVFLADATSSERRYPNVENMRNLADKSLDMAMLSFLSYEIGKLTGKMRTITADTYEAYNYFAYAKHLELSGGNA